jgi:signal transduction histidine kinase
LKITASAPGRAKKRLFNTLSFRLFVLSSIIILGSMLVIGTGLSIVSTLVVERSLRISAQTTADEIAQVLIDPLYQVNDDVVRSIGDIYLSTGRLSGVVIESELSGSLVNFPIEPGSSDLAISRTVEGYGFVLGRVTIWPANSELIQIRRSIWLVMSVMLVSILPVMILVSNGIIRRQLLSAFEPIIQGREYLSVGDYNHRISMTRYSDINSVIDQINGLISEIQTAQDELHSLNDSLEDKVAERSRELHEASRRLNVAERMLSLGNLVVGISHELNTPLGNAITAASLIREKIDNPDQGLSRQVLEEAMDSVLKNLTRAVSLIQDFRKIAHMDEGSEPTRFRIDEILNDIISLYAPRLHKLGIDMCLEMDTIEVKSYPDAFWPIISNFVENSIRHSGTATRIDIFVAREGDSTVLQYFDDGKGIPEEEVKKVFEPFFTTNRGAGNMGLGMYLVYNLVASRLQGSISLESGQGKGVHFYIRFPDLESGPISP